MTVPTRERRKTDPHVNPRYPQREAGFDPELWPPGWDNEPATAGGARTGTRWPDPEPIGAPAYGRPTLYPVDAVPAVFGDMIASVAANKQVPVDLPALMGQAAAATIVAPRLAIECEPGWIEPLNMYAACALGPGNLKSPATKDVIKEVRRLHKVLRASHADQVTEKRRQLGEQLARAKERKATKGLSDEDKASAESTIRETSAQLKELDEVISPRIVMPADVTPESLARDMSVNGEHGAILDSEGTFFAILSGRYSGGVPNLDSVLKSYDGDYVEVSRIGRDQRDMSRSVLTLGLAVQPTVLEEAAQSKAMVEQGLLARFYLSVPESLIGYRKPRGAPYNPQVLAAWATCLRRLADIPLADPETPEEAFPRLFLSDPAGSALFAYKAKMEPRLRADGELGDLAGWGSKHVGRTLRLAGLLHLIAGGRPSDPVGLGAMESAIRVGEWAIPHAITVFGMQEESAAAEDENALALLSWIHDKRPEVISVAEVNRNCRQSWVKKGKRVAVLTAIERLIEAGWLRPIEARDKANRPTVVYDRHERLKKDGPLW